MANNIRFTDKFRKVMYSNMWNYFNLDMIKSFYPSLKTSTIKGIENDNFTQSHKNTICFKDDGSCGHYVYVNNENIALSTFETNLLKNESDGGVCHAAALIYALECNNHKDSKKFHLIPNPKSNDEFKHNYKTILEFYIFLIESGKWDRAMKKNFYEDVTWIKNEKTTQETQNAIHELKNYIKRFE